MKLNLTKPLVVFDLETTGLDMVKDRVIQISYIKVYPDGREERGNELINPEKPLDPFITQLTGFSDEDLKDKPTFKQLAKKLEDVFKGSDIAGFNSNFFDVPMLKLVIDGSFVLTRKPACLIDSSPGADQPIVTAILFLPFCVSAYTFWISTAIASLVGGSAVYTAVTV